MLDQIFRQVQEIEKRVRAKAGAVWYRGLHDGSWTLTSSLHRHVQGALDAIRVTPTAEDKRGLLYDEATRIFN